MKMINVLQRLAELDAQNPNVVSAKPTVNPDAAVEAIQKTLSEELSTESLRYLSGVKKTIEECGMYPEGMGMMASPTPTPASFSINATAQSGDEVANMLNSIMSLAGVKPASPTSHEMPLTKEPAPTAPKADTGGDMKQMLDTIDNVENEEACPDCGMDPCQCDDHDHPEDEGLLGTMAGAGLGAALGGPLGAAVGGAAGNSITGKDESLGDEEVDISGVGGALAGAAIHGDADGAAKGMQDGEDESVTGANEEMRKLIDAVSQPEYDTTPNDPTNVPGNDANNFAYDPNQGGGGDRMDGNMPKGKVTAEDVTSQLFQEYQKFVTESEQRNMSQAAKGIMKYGKKGMKALADAGKKGKDLEPVRAKYNKYD